MKGTVYTKFIIGYILFGLFSFLTIAVLTSNWTFDHLAKEKAQDLYNEANLIANQYGSVYYNKKMSLSEVEVQLKAIDTFLNVQIWMTDTNGMIILTTRDSSLEDTYISDFDPISAGSKQYQVGDYYDMFEEEMISVCAPIISSFYTKGYIIIHSSVSSIKEARDSLLNISYITLFVILILSLIFLIIFTFIVYLPLKKITAAANAYASGNLKYNLKVYSNDEIGYLAGTLNYMAHELNKSEEYQRNFIANVSHDFRSPLTSIKGYIEAMKDGTIPIEMQEKYLDIVIFETERLTKLTNSLLTLNSYDSKVSLLDISTFDINQVIKHTAATFEGTCNKKKISFILTFSSKIQFVNADMSKIEQVLYNLIDNAYKASFENGMIYLKAYQVDQHTVLEVKDNGRGMSEKTIRHALEPFYMEDKARSRKNGGSGLGLALCAKIADAHHAKLYIESQLGKGTSIYIEFRKE